jgi:rare lipoprotein A
MRRALAIAPLLAALGACGGLVVERDSGPAPGSRDSSQVPDAVPKDEPRSRYGNPESYVVFGKRYYVLKDSAGFRERGVASWYGEKFHGRRTSSGETYDMYAMTAAHKTLPLPTYVEVTNLNNGRQVVLRVNDRGPFHDNRIIDLSYTAAQKLDILRAGTGLVEVRAVDPRRGRETAPEPAPLPEPAPSAGSAAFYIQVGAFARRVNAEAMRDRLGVLGEALVQISEAAVDGNPVYRVRIGPLYEVDVADQIVAGLPGIGITDHHIVLEQE